MERNVDSMLGIRYSSRVKVGMALIVFVILTSALRQLTSTLASFRALPQTDDISQYERRFTEVKRFLPPNQIVSYSDDFAKFSLQCNAFVLARYSLAPTVLAPLDPGCRTTDEVSSRRSRLVLENSHDPRNQPYLLRLFPNTYFQQQPGSLARGRLQGADDLILLNDFGLGVRLYARAEK